MTDIDAAVRVAAFKWLEEQCLIYGSTLPRKLLEKGMPFRSEYVPLVGPQGIFKPRVLPEIPLSITTSPDSPYDDDHSTSSGYLFYKYRGRDPQHRDNRGLRAAMLQRIPLIYFLGIVPGKYLAAWPVYIVDDNPGALTFKVAVDEKTVDRLVGADPGAYDAAPPGEEDAKRRYITGQTRVRLHQQRFRERVLQAYREQCAMCRLKHPELLEAVHIIPDSEPEGDPAVTNGISLCNLHHTAFDRFILGIRPDYVIEVRRDILAEEDGPMLRHGLQGLHTQKLILPRSETQYPDTKRLELRYEKFRKFEIN